MKPIVAGKRALAPCEFTCTHKPRTNGVNVLDLLTLTDDMRGKQWRVAQIKQPGDDALEPGAAGKLAVDLAARCVNCHVMVSFSDEAPTAWVLLRLPSRYTRGVDFNGVAAQVRWFSFRGKVTNDETLKVAESIFKDGRTVYGNLSITETAAATAGEYTMSELKARFMYYTKEELSTFLGDAKLNKAGGRATGLEIAVLTVAQELRTFVSDMNEAMVLVQKVNAPSARRIPDDFKPDVMQLTGVIWNYIDGRLEDFTLDKWLNELNLHNYMRTTLVLVGKSGCGKSELALAIARELSQRHDRERFAFVKNLDAVGRLTMAGITSQLGAMVFADFDLKARLQSQPLEIEEVKAMLDPCESGGYNCRYHDAILEKWCPRIWTINSATQAGGGGEDYGAWFKKQQHASSLDAMVKRDTAWLASAGADAIGVARRAFIVKIEAPVFEVTAAGPDLSTESAHFNAGLKNKYRNL